ncbi:MAG TPA: UbiA family prenyltransferase [Candidatus Eisenbacteria bacterium]|nr:UbiA family prenyltransferase [Candidatus Eisenbacteria bacterium]
MVRPANLLALLLAVGAGAKLAGGDPFVPVALVPALVAGFGYARNDAVDAVADALNRPGRAIPAGRVSVAAAHTLAWAALAAAWALLAITAIPNPSLPRVALLVAASAALYFYSPWGKGLGPLGASTIALLAGLAVIWGATMGPHPERAVSAALLAALATFARECAKDLEDESGDRRAGKVTWPIRAGRPTVARAVRVASWAAFAVVPLPWVLGSASPIYAVAAGLTACPLLAWAATRSLRDASSARHASRALKAALLAGIGSFWFGA